MEGIVKDLKQRVRKTNIEADGRNRREERAVVVVVGKCRAVHRIMYNANLQQSPMAGWPSGLRR